MADKGLWLKGLAAVLAVTAGLQARAQFPLDLSKWEAEPRYEYEYRDTMIMGGDGCRLVTEIYLPKGEGPWPVVVTRTPYVRHTECVDDQPIAREYAKRGLGYIRQRCRGTDGSEGTYEPNIYEREDGLALLRWLQAQPWCKNIGLTGMSYGALVCWIIADSVPDKVKGIHMHHYGVDRHLSAYSNGLFRQDILTSWAIENAKEPIKRPHHNFNEPFYDQLRYRPQADMAVDMLGCEMPWYRDWITHTDYTDPSWHEGVWATLRSIPAKIKVPVTIVAGFFDHHMEGTVLGYELLPPETKAQSRLIIGSWNHYYQTTPTAHQPKNDHELDVFADQFNWLFSVLAKDSVPEPEIKVYEIGADRWTTVDTWPLPSDEHRTWYLTAEPSACHAHAYSLQEGDSKSLSDSHIDYIYDPTDPVMSVGGETLFNSAQRRGSQLQPEPGYRDDVITFISEPLADDLTVSGNILVNLFMSSDAEDSAITYKVSEVMPDGSAYNIRTGIGTLAFRNDRLGSRGTYTPGEVAEFRFEALPIVWKIAKGHRLRLDVSSSDFPQYSVHSNYPGIWSLQDKTKPAHQQLHLGAQHPASITIPTKKQ